MKYLLIVSTLILEIIAWWYFITLISRTEYLARGTSIGNDVVLIMYILCTLICFLSTYLIYRKDVLRVVSIILFIIALIPSLGFLYLNLTGKIATSKKTASNYQQQYIEKNIQS